VSINKIVKTLRPLRTATITLADQQIQVPPRVPDDAHAYSTTSAVVPKPTQLRSGAPVWE
jgi:hypothetical protein